MKVEEKQDGQEETVLPDDMTEDASPEDNQSVSDDSQEMPGDSEDTSPSPEEALDEANDQLLRARAEFDNYRKRVARETQRIRKTAAESLITDLLPALDNLELALQHSESNSDGLLEGILMVQKQFKDALERNGLKPIAAMNEPFNPRVHEAVAHIPSSEETKDMILEEYQRGYFLGEQVLRPSKVVVGAGLAEAQEDQD